MSVGGNASDRAGETAPDEAIEALYTMDVRMYAVDGVVYVCAVVLSDLYIVNKSNAPRDEWGGHRTKNERALQVGRKNNIRGHVFCPGHKIFASADGVDTRYSPVWTCPPNDLQAGVQIHRLTRRVVFK